MLNDQVENSNKQQARAGDVCFVSQLPWTWTEVVFGYSTYVVCVVVVAAASAAPAAAALWVSSEIGTKASAAPRTEALSSKTMEAVVKDRER